ncbi:MAG: hypothetical protein LLF98_11580 [Clostridium sp.]|uniref:hypothetical protein n=1 Tax=Clostridium sp. TaxID=1506 RepID=UPI0025BD9C38|nr:hypothetical protein [Clostridium sp.]MCE5221869.1 hypothetical protein [Clostridium sp.]
MILAIDPGNVESGYIITSDKLEVWDKGKVTNENLIFIIDDCIKASQEYDGENINVAIEMVASYGMAVGKEVFETCVWIGRFYQEIYKLGYEPRFVYRQEEKLNLCKSMKAKDSNIVQALIDRFAPNTSNKGKGTKKEPGWFYGFKKDIWQAYAVAVTYYDRYIAPNL